MTIDECIIETDDYRWLKYWLLCLRIGMAHKNLEISENKNDSSVCKIHSSTEEMDVNHCWLWVGTQANILSGG